MGIMDETIAALKAEDTPAEDNINQDTVETKAEDKPDDKPTEDGPKTDVDDDTPAEDGKKPPKDTSQFTKEEKAEHAFKRQLARQREKHQAEMQDLIKSFDQKFEDLKKELKPAPKKEPPKREQFEYDDDFVNALVKYNMEQEQAAKDEEASKTRKEQEEREAQEKAYEEQRQMVADTFQENCKTAIPEEERADFTAKVQLASANGLADLLDKAPVVRDYIFTTKRGPRLLHAMLKERDTFANVMRTAATSANPMAAYIELDDIARNFQYTKQEPAPAQQEPEPQRTMPKLGKPGSGGSKESALDVTNDEQALIKFMRKHI